MLSSRSSLLLAGSLFALSSIAAAPVLAATTNPVAAASVGTAAAPQFGRFGFDEAGTDRTVAPGDDFYAFANGTWTKATSIPADKSNYGSFSVLDDLSHQRTRGILDAARADPVSKIGVAYAAYLDTDRIESLGLTPIQPWLDRIKALKTKEAYAALLAEADRAGIGGLFGDGVGQDDKSPDVYALGLSQAGLGLPDRDYYLSADPKLAQARDAYEAHVARMLTLAGEPDAAARAKALLAFETAIAKVSWTRTDSRDADKTYNKMAVADLVKSAPGFDFVTYFRGIGAPVETVIVSQPSAVSGSGDDGSSR